LATLRLAGSRRRSAQWPLLCLGSIHTRPSPTEPTSIAVRRFVALPNVRSRHFLTVHTYQVVTCGRSHCTRNITNEGVSGRQGMGLASHLKYFNLMQELELASLSDLTG
jgi:hypothetical protein